MMRQQIIWLLGKEYFPKNYGMKDKHKNTGKDRP